MSSSPNFQRLFEPYHIGQVKTRNRIVKTSSGMSFQTDDYMNEKSKAYYESLARGGVGLLLVESPAIDYPISLMFPKQFRLDDDRFIQGYSELAEVIHQQGCPAFLQMWHCGQWQQKALFGLQGVAASAINRGIRGGSHLPMETPRALTITEIEDVIDKFASTAVRAQKAGFDGVEVNASSNHLLSSFLSRIWNRRQDEYGNQSLETRARIVLEIIREIKKRCGPQFPVLTTINGFEIGGKGKDEDRDFKEVNQILSSQWKTGSAASWLHSCARPISILVTIQELPTWQLPVVLLPLLFSVLLIRRFGDPKAHKSILFAGNQGARSMGSQNQKKSLSLHWKQGLYAQKQGSC